MDKLKLLIADDELIVLDTMKSILQWPEYGIGEILTALDGESALSLFQSERPDIVITDIRMPKMGGLELISKIREEDESVSIIIFSAYSEFEYARQAISKKIVDYLVKPIHLPDFERIIQKIVAQIRENRARTDEGERHPAYKKIILDVMEYAAEHFCEDITLSSIAEKFLIDYCYLSKFFKKETGKLFSAYLMELRIAEAKKLLKNPDAKVYEVSEWIGYHDVKYFRKIFKESESLTPNEYHQLYNRVPENNATSGFFEKERR